MNRKIGKNIIETKCTREEFISLYKQNSLSSIAKKFKVCRMTAFYMARKYGLPYKPSGGTKGKKYKHINIDSKELNRLYNSMTTIDLAKKLKLSIPTLLERLKNVGIKMKKGGRKPRV